MRRGDKIKNIERANIVSEQMHLKSNSLIREGKWSKIMKGVKSSEYGGPWAVVAIENNKVVDQKIVEIRDLIPAVYEELKRKNSRATIIIENSSGQVVYSDKGVNEESVYGAWQKRLKNPDSEEEKKRRATSKRPWMREESDYDASEEREERDRYHTDMFDKWMEPHNVNPDTAPIKGDIKFDTSNPSEALLRAGVDTAQIDSHIENFLLEAIPDEVYEAEGELRNAYYQYISDRIKQYGSLSAGM